MPELKDSNPAPEVKPSANSPVSPAPEKKDESMLSKAADLATGALGMVAKNVANQLDSNIGDEVKEEEKNEKKPGEEPQQNKKPKHNEEVEGEKKSNPMLELLESLRANVEGLNKTIFKPLYDKMDDAVEKAKAGVGAATEYASSNVKEGASNLVEKAQKMFSGEKPADTKGSEVEMKSMSSSSNSQANPLAPLANVPKDNVPTTPAEPASLNPLDLIPGPSKSL